MFSPIWSSKSGGKSGRRPRRPLGRRRSIARLPRCVEDTLVDLAVASSRSRSLLVAALARRISKPIPYLEVDVAGRKNARMPGQTGGVIAIPKCCKASRVGCWDGATGKVSASRMCKKNWEREKIPRQPLPHHARTYVACFFFLYKLQG